MIFIIIKVILGRGRLVINIVFFFIGIFKGLVKFLFFKGGKEFFKN